jgi:hypothetical protein
MGPKPNRRMRNRAAATLSIFPALLAGFVLLLALPGQAAAAKPCWERVIDDWLADGRIDGTFKVSCYQAALKNVQEDLRDYSNVTDVIQAAMQDALRARSSNIPKGPTSTPGGTSGIDTTPSAKTRKLQNVPPRSYYRRAIDNLGTTKADSLPIPLLVLAALGSLLLLTATGLAGAKRYRAVRHRQKPPPSP